MITIIPARGDSKGLPGKNTKLLGGQPLIAHTIAAAKRSKYISRIFVSTDSEEIAEVAREHGAEVPYLRPQILATDTSMVLDSYLHLIDALEKQEGLQIFEFTALLPTVPLRTHIDIDTAIKLYREKDADSVISMTNSVPIGWYHKVTEDGSLVPVIESSSSIANRQDYDQYVIPTGAIYILQTQKIRDKRTYYFKQTYPYMMPKCRSIDIDSLDDFLLAEAILASRACSKIL
jgi:N-acylneuraminate cytidylyltransferase/CMP-N,N'-diacetyllegionaminic acid synthase